MTLRAAVVQHCAWPDKQQSLAESERLLADLAKKHQPELVLFQELHTTHYFCQVEDPVLFDMAEALDGPSAQRLSALAKKYNCVLVGAWCVSQYRTGVRQGWFARRLLPQDAHPG